MNPQQQHNVAMVARWLQVINDFNGEPLLLIAETTHGETHRLHIFSDEAISVPTALTILQDALQHALHHETEIPLTIAPNRLP